MRDIFINLKRFEVPRSIGGVCPEESPTAWIAGVLNSCRELGLAKLTDLRFSFFVPEALIPAAVEASRGEFAIGSQGVFRRTLSPVRTSAPLPPTFRQLPQQILAAAGVSLAIRKSAGISWV